MGYPPPTVRVDFPDGNWVQATVDQWIIAILEELDLEMRVRVLKRLIAQVQAIQAEQQKPRIIPPNGGISFPN